MAEKMRATISFVADWLYAAIRTLAFVVQSHSLPRFNDCGSFGGDKIAIDFDPMLYRRIVRRMNYEPRRVWLSKTGDNPNRPIRHVAIIIVV